MQLTGPLALEGESDLCVHVCWGGGAKLKGVQSYAICDEMACFNTN